MSLYRPKFSSFRHTITSSCSFLRPAVQQRRFVATNGAGAAEPQVEELTKRIAERLPVGDRAALSKAITLVESKLKRHHAEAQYILNHVQQNNPNVNRAFKIGICGPPGVGKSSFIEVFGKHLTSQGTKVAVIAVDPSSQRTGGSILGDKTRMVELSRDPLAFIRPSPSAGFLGGVTANAFETISLCESAGYDIVLVETVGLGQSETQIADLVDCVLLLVPPGGGDDLQGIKRGIVEIADIIVVNKADGELEPQARRTATEYMHALHFMTPGTRSWTPKVILNSNHSPDKIANVQKNILRFREAMESSHELDERRQAQRKAWTWKQVQEELISRLYHDEATQEEIEKLQDRVGKGEISPRMAASYILDSFFSAHDKEFHDRSFKPKE